MPPLAPLALRYLVWIVGLRLLYIAAVNVLGVPNTLATPVILAAAPAVDIAMQALRHAARPLGLKDWATIWGVLMAVYLILNVVLPAVLVPGFRAALSDGSGLGVLALLSLSTGLLLALFLWIGARSRRRSGG